MDLQSELFTNSGALKIGVLPFSWLEESMTASMKRKHQRLCPWAKSVISFSFSYPKGETGNLAAFSQGRDYHLVLREKLDEIREELQKRYPENRFLSFVDNAPYSEVLASAFSGTGILGKNGLIQNPGFGARILLGEIVTDAVLLYPEEKAAESCLNCLRCVSACPTGAMTVKNGRRVLDRRKCLSAISQKKGDLSEEEIECLKKSAYIWGCDACINACPERDGRTPHRLSYGKSEERIGSLILSDLCALTNAEFRKKYPERSFTWRGVEPLIRNLRLKEDK